MRCEGRKSFSHTCHHDAGINKAAYFLRLSFAKVSNTKNMLNRQTCQGILCVSTQSPNTKYQNAANNKHIKILQQQKYPKYLIAKITNYHGRDLYFKELTNMATAPRTVTGPDLMRPKMPLGVREERMTAGQKLCDTRRNGVLFRDATIRRREKRVASS